MATMKEVADLAGVSTATVSHVVNGTKRILACIQNPDAPPQREIVECSIIKRESV